MRTREYRAKVAMAYAGAWEDARERLVGRSVGRSARAGGGQRASQTESASRSRATSIDARTYRDHVWTRARRDLDVRQRGVPRGEERRADGA